MSNITLNPKRIKVKPLVILLIALILLGTCSKIKYDVIVENTINRKLICCFGNEIASIDSNKIQYVGSFKEGSYNWELWIWINNDCYQESSGEIYLSQDKVLFVFLNDSGKYESNWQ